MKDVFGLSDPQIVDIMLEVQRRWGHKGMQRASDMRSEHRLLPSGNIALDELLAGGWPIGKISSIIGVPTSGITTLAYQCIAYTHKNRGEVVYIDMSSTFNGGYAKACGIDIDRLLIVQPVDTLSALTLSKDIALSQMVKLLILDIGQNKNLPLKRLYPSLDKSHMVLLVLSSKPHQQTHLQVDIHCNKWLKYEWDVVGCEIEATLCKHPRIPVGKTAKFELKFCKGIEHD